MAKTFRLVTFRAPARRCVGVLAALAVAAFVSSAQAQFGVPGGIAPYTINDPAAAAAGGYGGGVASCYWAPRGRGGGETQCPVRTPAAPNKPAEAGKK